MRLQHAVALARHLGAEHPHRARGRRDEPHQHRDRGGLAGAVAAEQAGDRAGRQRERNAVDRRRGLVDLHEAVGANGGLGTGIHGLVRGMPHIWPLRGCDARGAASFGPTAPQQASPLYLTHAGHLRAHRVLPHRAAEDAGRAALVRGHRPGDRRAGGPLRVRVRAAARRLPVGDRAVGLAQRCDAHAFPQRAAACRRGRWRCCSATTSRSSPC